jgi:hypothetical protein
MCKDVIVGNLRGILNSGKLNQDEYETICDAIRALGGNP